MLLDATAVMDEEELDQEPGQPAEECQAESDNMQTEQEAAQAENEMQNVDTPVHTITIPIPPELQTNVRLLLQRGDSDCWKAAYQVMRDYEVPPPSNQNRTEYLDADDLGLNEAVLAACDHANYFVCTNSADDDPKANKVGEILDDWYNSKKIDGEITEAIFDGDPTNENEPATIPTSNDPTPTVEAAACCSTSAGECVTVTVPPANGITDESQKEWEITKNRLAFEIAELEIEIAEGKADIKAKQKQKDNTREELERHIARGPEEMPLFDRPPAPVTSPTTPPAAQSSPVTSAPSESPTNVAETSLADKPADAEVVEKEAAENPTTTTDDDESWRQRPIAELVGLTEKIVEILHDNDIITLDDWVNVPLRRGCEYTQLKGITEKRLEKIQDAMMKVHQQ